MNLLNCNVVGELPGEMSGLGLIQRRNAVPDSSEADNEAHCLENKRIDDNAVKETSLTLMEEVFLLGLKDKEGSTSFWNDSISSGLRGCVLVELALRGRIEIESKSSSGRNKCLLTKKVVVKDEAPTGDAILDEALKHIRSANPPESVANWISYLSGETWNIFKLKYQLKNVRHRLAKNLSEKGILSTVKQQFYFFDVTAHPLVNDGVKAGVIKKIQNSLLSSWENDVSKFDKRMLALILLCNASDVLEVALLSLNNDGYDLALKRVRELVDLDFQEESLKCASSSALYWAVFAALIQ